MEIECFCLCVIPLSNSQRVWLVLEKSDILKPSTSVAEMSLVMVTRTVGECWSFLYLQFPKCIEDFSCSRGLYSMFCPSIQT